jgi:hypothetical protein
MITNIYEYYKSEEIASIRNEVKSKLGWNKARSSFLIDFIFALIKVRTVCLTEIAVALSGSAQIASKYKKLQRFFRHFEIDFNIFAKFLSRLIPIPENSQWILTMDRTNWQFGIAKINILLLGIAHQGIAFPLIWITLYKKGNSNTKERIEIITKFISLFGIDKIKSLTADREFVGHTWFKWLLDNAVPFSIRVRNNFQVLSSKGNQIAVKELFKNLRKGEYRVLKGRRMICGVKLYIIGSKLHDGRFLILVTDKKPEIALENYKKRWEIETLFGCFKSRGFNFESTHICALDRIMKMIALLSIAFYWCYLSGEWKNSQRRIKLKSHGRKAISTFRYGLDVIRSILFNPYQNQNKLSKILGIFIDSLRHNYKHIDNMA